MEKLTLILFSIIGILLNSNAQNPQWLNYTNGDNIKALAEEGNNIWVGTEGGLVKLDKTTGNQTFYNKSNSGLPDNVVLSIAIDQNGTKWIGTKGGLVEFDGTNWSTYNTSNSGLPNNTVTEITIDENGTKWIGTLYRGLAVFNGNGIPVSVKENVLANSWVNISPNPTNDKLNIESLNNLNSSCIEIMNMHGSLLKSQFIANNQQTIDMSYLPVGIYFIRIYTEDGIVIKKLIKQ